MGRLGAWRRDELGRWLRLLGVSAVLAGAEGTVLWLWRTQEAEARARPVELGQVPESDMGIDFEHPTKEGLYPLFQMSTGKRIVEKGRPVLMDKGGMRAR